MINEKEAWMQKRAETTIHADLEVCRYCSGKPAASEKLGQQIVKSSEGRTLVLMERGSRFVDLSSPVEEIDATCWLWPGFSPFIVRRVDQDNWTRVGYFNPFFTFLVSNTGTRFSDMSEI